MSTPRKKKSRAGDDDTPPSQAPDYMDIDISDDHGGNTLTTAPSASTGNDKTDGSSKDAAAAAAAASVGGAHEIGEIEEGGTTLDSSESGSTDPWSSFLATHTDRKGMIESLKLNFKVLKKTRDWGRLGLERREAKLCSVMESYFDDTEKRDACIALAILEERDIPSEDDEERFSGHRGALITDGLELGMSHSYDLQEFSRRIDDLFEWHTNLSVQQEYTAPYFALLQSSGMGKTKLFTEYRKQCNQGDNRGNADEVVCLTLLCVNQELAKKATYYDQDFIFEVGPTKENATESVFGKLENTIGASKAKEDNKIVLLFDEAQGLMIGDDGDERGNLVFRSIRWWLRKERKQKIVAVFAGTTARITSFFPPDPPKLGVSRLPKVRYKNCEEGKQDKTTRLFPPFFALNTVGCLNRSGTGSSEFQSEDVTLKTAVLYGRPLFAYYQIEEKLDDLVTTFLRRLVLSSENYPNDNIACYSVLGTRVQMGVVPSFETVSNLVSGGYACLVDFKMQRDQTGKPTALIAFMPDPLCAAMAMKLMNQNSAFSSCNIRGESKSFWVNKAKVAFTSNLCRPEKGDAGEVFSALYLLFCGDLLREKADATMGTFSVSLEDWFSYVRNGGDTSAAYLDESASPQVVGKKTRNMTLSEAKQEDYTVVKSMKVSFIQFCRNHLRSDSYCCHSLLSNSYHSGVAFYTYSNCKAIDQVASIRVEWERDSDPITYHPLLISVKNWASATISDTVAWTQSMKAFLEEMRKNEEGSKCKAFCLLVLIGCCNPPFPTEKNLSDNSLGVFPNEDIYRLAIVPAEDKFGITSAVQSLGLVSEKSEVYASHSFLRTAKSIEGNLRPMSKLKDEAEKLRQALANI